MVVGGGDTTRGEKTGRVRVTLEGHADAVCVLAALGNGRLASGSMDHLVKVWDVGAGHLACGLGHLACGLGHLACGLGHLACGLGHMACGLGHLAWFD